MHVCVHIHKSAMDMKLLGIGNLNEIMYEQRIYKCFWFTEAISSFLKLNWIKRLWR